MKRRKFIQAIAAIAGAAALPSSKLTYEQAIVEEIGKINFPGLVTKTINLEGATFGFKPLPELRVSRVLDNGDIELEVVG